MHMQNWLTKKEKSFHESFFLLKNPPSIHVFCCEQKVRVWSCRSGEELDFFKAGIVHPVYTVALSPGEKILDMVLIWVVHHSFLQSTWPLVLRLVVVCANISSRLRVHVCRSNKQLQQQDETMVAEGSLDPVVRLWRMTDRVHGRLAQSQQQLADQEREEFMSRRFAPCLSLCLLFLRGGIYRLACFLHFTPHVDLGQRPARGCA
jgi:hypothetical protein